MPGPPSTPIPALAVEMPAPSGPALARAMGPEGHLAVARLARGARCRALSIQESIVAYGWVSAGPEWIGEIGLELTPGAGAAYVWNCVTLPEHRRQGLFRALLVAIRMEAVQEGLRRLWVANVEGTGESAIAGAGFSPVLHIAARPAPRLGWLTSRPAVSAPASVVAEARAAVGLGPRPRLRFTAARIH